MGTVVSVSFGGPAARVPPLVQVSPAHGNDRDKTVLGLGQRIQLPDGCLGNVEVLIGENGVSVNFSNRHVESIEYDFATLSRLIRRPRKGATVNGVVGFDAVTPVEVVYGGQTICSFVAVDSERKQVTILR